MIGNHLPLSEFKQKRTIELILHLRILRSEFRSCFWGSFAADRDTVISDPEKLKKAAHLARAVTLGLFLALFIIWPLRWLLIHYICWLFETDVLHGQHVWSCIYLLKDIISRLGYCVRSVGGELLVVSRDWFTVLPPLPYYFQFFAIFAVTVFPIIEGRHTLVSIIKSIFSRDKTSTTIKRNHIAETGHAHGAGTLLHENGSDSPITSEMDTKEKSY